MVGVPRGKVELEPYREEWRDHYEAEVERLNNIAGERFLEFEHVGSTAVEGLWAKPIIDILGAVEDLTAARDLVPVLEANGYEHRPDTDVDDRLFFAKGPRTNRTHYLSVTERNSDCYVEQLGFRDYLRDHPEVAERYASLKRRLAERYPDSRSRYTVEKEAFVRDVLDRATSDRREG